MRQLNEEQMARVGRFMDRLMLSVATFATAVHLFVLIVRRGRCDYLEWATLILLTILSAQLWTQYVRNRKLRT